MISPINDHPLLKLFSRKQIIQMGCRSDSPFKRKVKKIKTTSKLTISSKRVTNQILKNQKMGLTLECCNRYCLRIWNTYNPNNRWSKYYNNNNNNSSSNNSNNNNKCSSNSNSNNSNNSNSNNNNSSSRRRTSRCSWRGRCGWGEGRPRATARRGRRRSGGRRSRSCGRRPS